ncbi:MULTISPECIES: threonine synthase [Pseudomonas]|uniref:Putative threonine synthase n=1 Tax=Pseudomonas fluorescens (strain Pf0-1) TaxID=205922 RepID=Q3KDV0_PSEPF|nr:MULTISPECIES: threonine synthase [Pseudomonas]ABA74056.1 putative threonine synthase [Pseudomonas fluorescens Pf0-1]MBL0798563.1 threonine synthase [Pseudomonas sp. B7]MBX8621880.1 threonine synthase [Pseudomonas glycinae]MBY9026852.1 threonine synthase [Pseudomonas fluorescens]MBY9032462.1 threonine synthase [Pseudomonas fluorescens]
MKNSYREYVLQCLVCDRSYQPHEVSYFCPHCKVDGALDALYDYPTLRREWPKESLAHHQARGMWRYDRLMPLSSTQFIPPLLVGNTPLYAPTDLLGKGSRIKVLIKDESRQPTGSLKDRASALAVAHAMQSGARTVAVASTGNAASALAGMSASLGLHNVIYLPRSAPREKRAQMQGYGAEIVLVDGQYDEAFEQCLNACERYGWYNRTTGINSYMSEGKKTVAFEICEQLHWQVPDLVFVPVGNGCILGSVYKGFFDLLQLGWIERIPRLIGVQAEHSNFMYRAWRSDRPMQQTERIAPTSLASSINVALPRDRLKAMRAVTASEGEFMCVSDASIVAAASKLAASTGVFPEAGAASAFAGLLKYAEQHPDTAQTAVILITGSGLKDTSIFLSDTAASPSRVFPHHVPTTLTETLAQGITA